MWVGGLACVLYYCIFHGFINVHALAAIPPRLTLLNDMLSDADFNEAVLPPNFLEDLSTNNAGLSNLSKLNRIYYGGGPLEKTVGRVVSDYTTLTNVIVLSDRLKVNPIEIEMIINTHAIVRTALMIGQGSFNLYC